MAFEEICPPALIYLIFSTTQVVIDTVKGYYNLALTKLIVALIFTILLNYLCSLGLGIISWLIVFIPFILMTLIVSMLLLMFGLDPTTGKLKVYDPNVDTSQSTIQLDARQEATLAATSPTLLSSVTTSTPDGVYVDTAKNGKGVIQPASAADTKNEMEQMRKIKMIVDTIYHLTKNRKLSSYVLTTLDQCKTLSSEQCSNIWMREVRPTLVTKVGAAQTDKIFKALLNKFLAEGYSAQDTVGDIIVGKNNSPETPSTQTQKVLDDMSYTRAGTTSITTQNK